MKILFSKYHGTGNDFIMVDDRTLTFPVENQDLIQELCNRKFGIGADGLILLRDHGTLDFRMIYFNSDGLEGSMCGNGGRCAVSFAFHLGLAGEQQVFEAADGIHEAVLLEGSNVRLKMLDVAGVDRESDHYLLDTGSPHYVKFVDDLEELDVYGAGKAIRYSSAFKNVGVNVNFVQAEGDGIFVRTYERGVENETLSCGTGVVAAAIAASVEEHEGKSSYKIRTPGGRLLVSFKSKEVGSFSEVFLEGPAVYVYKGSLPTDI